MDGNARNHKWLKVRIMQLTSPLIDNILANDFTPVAVGTRYVEANLFLIKGEGATGSSLSCENEPTETSEISL